MDVAAPSGEVSGAAQCDLRRTATLIQDWVEAGELLGAQVWAGTADRILADRVWGCSEPGRSAAVTDVARLSCVAKPLTTVCVARAVERGAIDWDDPVSRFLSVRADAQHAGLTIRALLTHSAGLPPLWRSTYEQSFDEVVAKATTADIPAWMWTPEPRYDTSLGWHVLAAVLRVVEGEPVDRLISRDIAGPLGLPGLTLVDPPHPDRFAGLFKYEAPHRFVPIDWATPDGLFTVLNPAHGGVAGVGDLGGFWQELLRCVQGRGTVLSPARMTELLEPRSAVSMGPTLRTARWGMGVEVGLADHSLKGDWSPRTFGHRGAMPPRTVLLPFVDPDRELVGIIRLSSIDHRTNWRIWKISAALSADLEVAGY